MRKYIVKNERLILNPAYKDNVMPTINFKIYTLAGLSCIAFVGGIRLICEVLVMIQAA